MGCQILRSNRHPLQDILYSHIELSRFEKPERVSFYFCSLCHRLWGGILGTPPKRNPCRICSITETFRHRLQSPGLSDITHGDNTHSRLIVARRVAVPARVVMRLWARPWRVWHVQYSTYVHTAETGEPLARRRQRFWFWKEGILWRPVLPLSETGYGRVLIEGLCLPA